jgi:hypothetical protein
VVTRRAVHHRRVRVESGVGAGVLLRQILPLVAVQVPTDDYRQHHQSQEDDGQHTCDETVKMSDGLTSHETRNPTSGD